MFSGDDRFMAKGFKPVNRDQVMLLPPDMREWLPSDHLAWLVLDVVGQCDLSAITDSFRRGGTGREAYDPAMLTALLLYGYCCGERSSRRIERACVTDVAFRVISAQQSPDHTTIARFRARHDAALAGLFGQVLQICGKAGMGQVGIVAIDGTKIAGQASARKNYKEDHLRKLAADIIAEAGEVDAAEDALYGPDRSGDELPEELAPGADRASRIRAALDAIQKERQQEIDEDVAAAERKVDTARRAYDRERRVAQTRRAGRKARAGRRRRIEEHVKVKTARDRVARLEAELDLARNGEGLRATRCQPRANPSDPDTHSMFVRGKGFIQGFNAQFAVSDDHLILATDVTTVPSDRPSFIPMMNKAVDAVKDQLGAGQPIDTIVADAGYCSIEALTADGPDRLIATGRNPDTPSQPSKNKHILAMAHRLKPDSPGRQTYQRRAATVEPVIGTTKDQIGLRRFARRGLHAARHELALAATAFNIRRLATR
jgi:transposase